MCLLYMVSLKGPGLVRLAVEGLGDLRLLQPTPLSGMSQTHRPIVDKLVVGGSRKSWHLLLVHGANVQQDREQCVYLDLFPSADMLICDIQISDSQCLLCTNVPMCTICAR